jgi:hypothetical protein
VIRDLNPALLTMVAPAGFAAHVPKGAASDTQAALETVPAGNRQAWRLHHVEAGDTLTTIAKSYHLAPERIVAVNNNADTLEAGDTLLIPAIYHPDLARRTSHGRAKLTHVSASRTQARSAKSTLQRGTHVVASRRPSSQVLHRKAAVRTASLER